MGLWVVRCGRLWAVTGCGRLWRAVGYCDYISCIPTLCHRLVTISSCWPLGSSASLSFRVSCLEVLITNTCDPSVCKPNCVQRIKITEYINSKKADMWVPLIFMEWWQAQPAVLPMMFQRSHEAAILVARSTGHWNPQAALNARPVMPVCVPPSNSTNNTVNKFFCCFFECLQLFPGPDGPVMPRILDLVYRLQRINISEPAMVHSIRFFHASCYYHLRPSNQLMGLRMRTAKPDPQSCKSSPVDVLQHKFLARANPDAKGGLCNVSTSTGMALINSDGTPVINLSLAFLARIAELLTPARVSVVNSFKVVRAALIDAWFLH